MTASLADFINSPAGDIYGRLCSYYGKSPGHIFSDDVVAFQVDLAYMIRGPEPIPQVDDTPGVTTDLDAQIRAMR